MYLLCIQRQPDGRKVLAAFVPPAVSTIVPHHQLTTHARYSTKDDPPRTHAKRDQHQGDPGAFIQQTSGVIRGFSPRSAVCYHACTGTQKARSDRSCINVSFQNLLQCLNKSLTCVPSNNMHKSDSDAIRHLILDGFRREAGLDVPVACIHVHADRTGEVWGPRKKALVRYAQQLKARGQTSSI
jgi:hypothetical protein